MHWVRPSPLSALPSPPLHRASSRSAVSVYSLSSAAASRERTPTVAAKWPVLDGVKAELATDGVRRLLRTSRRCRKMNEDGGEVITFRRKQESLARTDEGPRGC